MAVANLNLPHFPISDTTEVDTLPQRWKTHKNRFEILCYAIGVNNEKQKLLMLLTYVGKKMYEIYHGTLIRTGITSKKIPCYMRNSACRWFIVKKAKIFRSRVEHF